MDEITTPCGRNHFFHPSSPLKTLQPLGNKAATRFMMIDSLSIVVKGMYYFHNKG